MKSNDNEKGASISRGPLQVFGLRPRFDRGGNKLPGAVIVPDKKGVRESRDGRTEYVFDGVALRRRFPKVKGKAAVKAMKRARQAERRALQHANKIGQQRDEAA